MNSSKYRYQCVAGTGLVPGIPLMGVVALAIGTPAWALALYAICCLGSGVLIGATGIGGVLLVPLLLLMDVPVGIANKAALASMVPAGMVALYSNYSLVPRETFTVALAVIPGTVAGSVIFPLVPPTITSCFMAFIAIFAGVRLICKEVHTARRKPLPLPGDGARLHSGTSTPREVLASIDDEVQCAPHESGDCGISQEKTNTPHIVLAQPAASQRPVDLAESSMGLRQTVVLGCVIGCFSVLTSTGGPFIAIPLLLHLRPHLPPAVVVALAQVLCIPVGLCSTLVGVATSTVDIGLAVLIGASMSSGIPFGARLARRTEPSRLKLAIAILLVGIGASALIKVLATNDPAARRSQSLLPCIDASASLDGSIDGCTQVNSTNHSTNHSTARA